MRTIIIAVSVALIAAPALAQSQAQVPTQGSVQVLDPAQISAGAQLSVDPVARPESGSRTATAKAGSYTLTGPGGQTYNLSVPSSVKLTRSGGTEEIELTLKPSSTSGTFGGSQDQVTARQVGVGGSAPVTSASKGGVYQGEVPVTLTYQ